MGEEYTEDLEDMTQEQETAAQDNKNTPEAEDAEKRRKREEMIRKAKEFAWENRDALVLGGQLFLVALVCVVGIGNDLAAQNGCCKCKKKKRKR